MVKGMVSSWCLMLQEFGTGAADGAREEPGGEVLSIYNVSDAGLPRRSNSVSPGTEESPTHTGCKHPTYKISNGALLDPSSPSFGDICLAHIL